MTRLAALLMLATASLAGLAAQSAPTGAPGSAAPAPTGMKSFDFKDPKGVNAISISLDSELEPMIGTGSAVSGTLTLDPAHPEGATGELKLDASSIHMTNDRMTGVLHGADWLDVQNHPAVTVAITKVSQVKSAGSNVFDLVCDANITIKGVSKTQSIPVKATYLPGRAGDRMRGSQGDLLVLRSSFIVKRSDYGIKLDSPVTVVADEIRITGAIVGIAAGS